MKKINRFAAAAVSFALAATAAGCSAPGAVTIGNNTKNAVTIDGYEVPAGVFIAYELVAYNNAAYQCAASTNTEPSVDDVKKYHIEGTDSATWIQDQATEQCCQLVAIEKEFEKINGSLTDEELDQINESISSVPENTREYYDKNGIGEESLKKVFSVSLKSNYIFDYYYGIGGPNGCTEEELKKYFVENNARVKYIEIKTADGEGNKYDEDTIHDLNKMADDFVNRINAEKDDEDKLDKMDELKEEYEEYAASLTTTVSGQTETTTTTTTTAASGSSQSTTTTTTDPHANEKIVVKLTTTTAAKDEEATTTEPVEKTDAQKASEKLDEKIFGGDMPLYTAEKYQYDDNTIYVIIKADIEERMTDEDMWTDDIKEQLISQRYFSNYSEWIEEIAKGYSVDKNKSAYKRYAPFKLKLDEDSK